MEISIVEHQSAHRHHHRHRTTHVATGVLVFWFIAAYLLIPSAWEFYADRHPAFDDNPRVTQTGDKHPGDPLNVALIGSEAEVQEIMKAAKWYPAAPLGLASDLRIGADTILARPDEEAPVSNLYLFGRKEDFAFEQPVGDNPRHRHHVRLWWTGEVGADGRQQWIGAAVYDEKVGFSRTTGQITHITAPNVDAERDYLFQCLERTDQLTDQYKVDDFHHERSGRNGGGDLWETDGKLRVGVVAEIDQ
jgi:hypothetical protein